MRALSALFLLALFAVTGFFAWNYLDQIKEPIHLRFSAGSSTDEYYDFVSCESRTTKHHREQVSLRTHEAFDRAPAAA